MTAPSRIHSPQPWIEKYRPKNLDEVAAQNHVVSVLRKAVDDGNLPHLLFFGPPGTGKTSTILALAREIFREHFKERVLELNASDDRGISVVRHKIKDFSKSLVATTESATHKPIPPYKLVILDEADSMTSDAQGALRRTMEAYSSTTRFCIICNYVNKIMEPLASRCAKFRFQPVENNRALEKLHFIAKSENLIIQDDILNFLIDFSDGDLRKSINLLQSAFRIVSMNSHAVVTMDLVHQLTGHIPDTLIHAFIKNVSSLSQAKTQINDLIRSGYSLHQFMKQLHHTLINSFELTSLQKSLLAPKFATIEKCILEGADTELQFMSLVADMSIAMDTCKKQISLYS